jgi:stearoyl-CoA desaturase (Delta-9 desaturase)
MKLWEVPAGQVVRAPGKKARTLRDYQWGGSVPFFVIHLLPLFALATGARWQDWVCCFGLVALRIFGVTAGYHRYFAHRTYKTSRIGQFLLAFLAQTSVQKGALWWAAHHREHHRHSDTDRDPHSPIRYGFWYAHVGWLFDETTKTDYARVKDLARYPELVVLNKFHLLPPIVLGVAVWLALGWSGLWIGFMLSTVLTWHLTFAINSMTHIVGKQRFDSGDRSLNHWLLGLLTFGEGWHNNHHYFQSSTRQGFFWWEIDLSYYVLRLLAVFGLVWDLKEPPARVYEEVRRARAQGQGVLAGTAPTPAPLAATPAALGAAVHQPEALGG